MIGKIFLLPVIVLLFASIWTVGLILPDKKHSGEGDIYRYEDGTFFQTRQNTVLSEASKLYGRLGCAECHAQGLTKLHIGREGGMEGVRLTLPDDYMGDYTAHLSPGLRAPALVHPHKKIGEYISVKELGGEEIRYGTEKEWVLLHLYNPRDPVFGAPASTCPALPFLFREVSAYDARFTHKALPVAMPEGRILVPTEKAEMLADYLLSLDRQTPLPPQLAKARKHFKPVDWENHQLPVTGNDVGPSERELFLKEGARVFSAQCSVCHGHDGTGDGFNYPPLAGSEWMALPPEAISEVVLRGLRGPIEVNGKKWDNYMTPLGPRLTDTQIAAVVTHVLSAFAPENKTEATIDMVNELRERTKGAEPLKPEELFEKLPKNTK